MASRLVDKQVGSIRLQGFSLAGEETVVILPELNLAFDVGRAPREVVNIGHICLSHGHMDHAAGLAYYFSQRNFQGLASGCVICHHKLVPAIEDLMRVWSRIEGHPSPARVVGVDEDEDFTLRRDLVVRPFRVRHAGPTLGFAAVEVRKKLKPQYADLSGPQIVELKRAGHTVEYRVELPKVAYCADSMVGDYLDHDHVRNSEVLIVECTFFDADHAERARMGQHTHACDLPELMERVSSPHVVLIHLTRRTGVTEAKRVLARVLQPADLERITILMDLSRSRRAALGPQQPSSQDNLASRDD